MKNISEHPRISPPASPNIRQLMDELKTVMKLNIPLTGDDELRAILQVAIDHMKGCIG